MHSPRSIYRGFNLANSSNNPYRSPESQQTVRLGDAKQNVKKKLLTWRASAIVAFMLLLLFPSGMVIHVLDGSPTKHVYFWWGYVPDSILNAGFRFRMTERVITVVSHLVFSALLCCLIQLVAYLFRRLKAKVAG